MAFSISLGSYLSLVRSQMALTLWHTSPKAIRLMQVSQSAGCCPSSVTASR